MATAEHLATSDIGGGQRVPDYAISVATLGAVTAVLLMYVSSSFQIADIFGVKRIAQVLLILPIGAVASYFIVSRPARLLDPLILFALTKVGTEIALRGRWSYVLDSVSAVFALTVLSCAPARSFETAARVLVTASGILALMALIQWAIIIYAPDLNVFVLGPVDEGEHQDSIRHPIALLGLGLPHEYTLGGLTVGRMQSFAKEPSLNVIYFMFPASLAFLRRAPGSVAWGCILLTYCVLSLSGSVFLACVFAGMWWVVGRVTSIRMAVPYGMLLMMVAYVAGLHFSALSIMSALDSISQYGDFLSKTRSVTGRGQGAVTNADAALISPLGGMSASDVPGPWLVNSALAAGWLGAIFLIWYLAKFGRELQIFYDRSPRFSTERFGCILLLGVLASALIFNDYQMGNYAGLVLVGVLYRTMLLRNRTQTAVLG
jgi:hypothetical protein